jgi:hypothetical protein
MFSTGAKNGKIKGELGSKAMHREVEKFEGTHVLREESEVYGSKSRGTNHVEINVGQTAMQVFVKLDGSGMICKC